MRYLKQNTGPNRHQRRAQYAAPSRSKPYLQRSSKAMYTEDRGRKRIEALIVRGIILNTPQQQPKIARLKRVTAAVGRAIRSR